MNRKEKAQALSDKAWWEELATAVGWRLYGWTWRTGASFFTRPQYAYDQNPGLIEVTGAQRDEILEAIAGHVPAPAEPCDHAVIGPCPHYSP